MSQEVIEITEREIEVIEVVERGPAGPTGPQPNINYEVVSNARTLEAADLIAADTSGGAFTLTLPANPNAGDAVDIFDYSETFDTNPLTIARNGENIESIAEDLICNVEGAYFTMIYTGATRGWQILPRYGTTGGGGESVLTTEGDMVYRGAAINERLPIGSAGQILKVNSGGNAPEWGAAPATGVTSVGVTGSDGIEVDSGSPVTGSGTIALGVNAATLRSHINVADGAEVNVQSNWTEADSGSDAFILNKPSTFTPSAHASSHEGDATDPVALTRYTQIQDAVLDNPSGFKADLIYSYSELLDVPATFTPASHTHGNLSNDGKIGSTSGLPLKTGTSGAVEAGAFGTSAGEFCEGNDARLSDDRNPTSHASSHASAGSDPLFDQDLNTTDAPTFTSVSAAGNIGTLTMDDYGLVWENVRRWSVDVGSFLDSSETQALEISNDVSGGSANISYVPIDFGGANAATNAATTRTNLGLGDAATADIGTGSTEVAAGDHGHGNINSSGLVGTTANLPLKTGTGGIVEAGAFGTGAGEFSEGNHTHELTALDATGATNGHVLTAQGDGTAAFAAASGGVTAVNSTLADILSVSGSDLVADDLGTDKLYGWDDSESKAIGFTIGSGLSVSGDTLSATASGGSKTYATFAATDNQPPASNYATLDTRNSIAVLDFDDATDESAVFVSIIPEGASLGSGLKIRLHWMATTATSGNVVWDVSLERMTTDLDSDSFDTIASGTAAANGTSGILTVTEITLTTIDSVTAGDGYRLNVTRDANNASDTMTGDAELVVCEVRSAA